MNLTGTKPASINDVARLARVSTATVSRALSSPERVRPQTLERVQQAINQLGYVSHGVARALASRRTYTVGGIFPSLDTVFADTTEALQRELDRAGYMLVLACNDYDPSAELRLARNFIERGVDGMVLVGTTHEPDLMSLLRRFSVPYVLTWARDSAGKHPCVGFDNAQATALATQYLLDRGHERFGVISGIVANNDRAQARLRGIQETLIRSGITLDPSMVVEAPFSFSAGRSAFRLLFERSPSITAVVCSNDILAAGALSACRAIGLSVPGEMSVAGSGDFAIGEMVSPSLTTVRWPTVELGMRAAEQVVAQLNGASPVQDDIQLPVKLVVRDSTSGPRCGNTVFPASRRSAPTRQ
jgi:LacI family transcriptional regulator